MTTHLVAHWEVRGVLEQYCSLLDAGAVDDLLKLFDDDCTFAMLGHTYVGKAEFAQVWKSLGPADRPSTLHALVNPSITVTGNHATAVSGWMMIDRSGDGGSTHVSMAGRYHDSLRRDSAQQWRFTSRRVETLGRLAPR